MNCEPELLMERSENIQYRCPRHMVAKEQMSSSGRGGVCMNAGGVQWSVIV